MPAYMACSSSGAISSQIHLATIAGLKILEDGGNAFDAAIAISSVLTILLPHTSSIGGDGFLLAVDSGGSLIAYNGSGRSPNGFPAGTYLAEKPVRGPLTVTIPGLVDLWEWVNENYGSKDLRLLLGKAVSLARNGFNVQEPLARAVEASKPMLLSYTSWRQVFGSLCNGAVIRFPKLAKIYSLIARGGADVFYRGVITEELVEELRRSGVPVTYQDFAEHRGEKVDPIKCSYGDYELYELPPNSQGLSTLQLAKAMETAGINRLPFRSAERIKFFLELAAAVYGDRNRHVADPAYYRVPVEEILSLDYLKKRIIGAGVSGTRLSSGDTTFFVVADKYGNLVGFIQSIFHVFGSGIVACEIPFQNRGAGFAGEPGLPNSPAPGKRPLHTLSILLARGSRGDDYIIGCAGGDFRPQIHVEVLTNIVDYRMSLSKAVEAPRYILTRWEGDRLEAVVEAGLAVKGLSSWIRNIGFQKPTTGIVHALKRDGKGVMETVADPRGGGVAAPLL